MNKTVEYDIKCRSCKRFLGVAKNSMQAELKCSNSKCKKLDTYKVVFLSDYMKQHNHSHSKPVDK